MKFKKLRLLARICALAFAPVFLIKILLNNRNCILIMEPILEVRIIEALIAVFIIFFLGYDIIVDWWNK